MLPDEWLAERRRRGAVIELYGFLSAVIKWGVVVYIGYVINHFVDKFW